MAVSRNSGFTLLEVLIALVIASLALGVLFSGAVTGLRSTQISIHYEEAVSRSRSHLAVIGVGSPVTPGDQSGDDGSGFHWHVHIAPVTSGVATFGEIDPAHAPRVVLYVVDVAVSWAMDGSPRSVTLQSQRTGLIAPPTP